MYDLISIGNISTDIYFSADELTKKDDRLYLAVGGKYRIEEYELHVGGGGANVAIGARRYGLKTAVVGMVGNNAFRKNTMARLKTGKVSTEFVLFNQKDTNLSVILLGSNGERTILVHSAPHRHLQAEQKIVRAIAKTNVRAVYFGNMPDVGVQVRARLKKQLVEKGVFTVVNLGAADCRRNEDEIEALLTYTKMLIVNTHEFAQLVKKTREEIDFQSSVSHMVPSMKSDLIVVTDGKNGSYAYMDGQVYYQPAKNAKKIVDTTGCGDAYTAAFIASYVRHEDVARAMRAGSAYAVIILAKKGAN